MGLTLTDRRQLQFTGLAAVVAVLFAGGLYLVLQPPGRLVTAYFTSTAALFEDNSVDVLGVPVGTITKIEPQGTTVRVQMRITDSSLKLPADVRAVEVSPSMVTGRYVQLTPTWSGGPELADGAVIPVERTAVPLGVDDLTRTATELANALGPNGANAKGALSDVLNVGAQNLDGNGQKLNDTIHNLGELSGTLANSRQDLFGTVTELQSFVSMLAANDSQVREFNGRLADVSGFLANERGDLGAAVSELSIALGDVANFVRDNRSEIKSNVDKLTDVTAVLVKQQKALAEILDVAPAALGNLSNTYNGSSGTLDTRADINELSTPSVVLICQALKRGTPANLPPNLTNTCSQLEPILSGAVPLPSAAQVITALQSGQAPPVPGLALPTLPGPLPGAKAPAGGNR
ncbi:MAG: phospholipid/cholesterol/gamma-HCH transport system substrate-binding protein [Pseudonocardiales bacterium]|nr:phospholipid/cholesterol/gamma-HCH transport system substrate-binding protein [Pseudonocardiales bacterium]